MTRPPRAAAWLVLAPLVLLTTMGLAPRQQDNPDISITQLHVFVVKAEGRLQISEYYLAGNAAGQPYEGVKDPILGERVTLSFTLPDGAEDLAFDGPGLGERFVATEAGFADTEPIPPGTATSDVLFSYQLPYSEGMALQRTFAAPVASVVVVLVSDGLALEGEGIVPAGPIETQMGPALAYTAGPIEPGETLALAFVAGPTLAPTAPEQPAGSAAGRNPGLEAAIGMVALAAAIVAAYLMLRTPVATTPPAPVRPLVERITALDMAFEAGQVEAQTYRRERQRIKQQIVTKLEEAGEH